MTDDELREQFPFIRWDEPLHVIRTDGLAVFVCRYCVAHDGLRAVDLDQWPQTRIAAEEHIQDEHGR